MDFEAYFASELDSVAAISSDPRIPVLGRCRSMRIPPRVETTNARSTTSVGGGVQKEKDRGIICRRVDDVEQ